MTGLGPRWYEWVIGPLLPLAGAAIGVWLKSTDNVLLSSITIGALCGSLFLIPAYVE